MIYTSIKLVHKKIIIINQKIIINQTYAITWRQWTRKKKKVTTFFTSNSDSWDFTRILSAKLKQVKILMRLNYNFE